MIKNLLKSIYSYRYNGFKLIRFAKFGKNAFIGKGLQSNMPPKVYIGNNARIGKNARLDCYKTEGHDAKIIIHDNVYIGNDFSVLAGDTIEIDEYVLIASYVTVVGENHQTDPESPLHYCKQSLVAKPVRIGIGCWIGEKVIILPGVEIGEKCVIGAGSVVTKGIPAYSLVVGNPARVIKKYNFRTKEWERC